MKYFFSLGHFSLAKLSGPMEACARQAEKQLVCHPRLTGGPQRRLASIFVARAAGSLPAFLESRGEPSCAIHSLRVKEHFELRKKNKKAFP